MKSWKTTLAGIGTILAGVGGGIKLIAAGQTVEGFSSIVAGITAGTGLISPRDNSKTSKPVGAK